jgi:hypothetical protein
MSEVAIRSLRRYETWDVFKRAVESKLGHYVDNNLWLQAKPRKPLPWTESDLEQSIKYVEKVYF